MRAQRIGHHVLNWLRFIFTEFRNFSFDFVFIIIRTDKNKTLNAFCLQLSKWSDLFDVPDQTLLALFCITFWDHLNLLCKWIWKFVVHSFIRLVKKNITRIESVVFCYSESCQAQFTWSSTWSDQRGAMSLYVCDIFVPPPALPWSKHLKGQLGPPELSAVGFGLVI